MANNLHADDLAEESADTVIYALHGSQGLQLWHPLQQRKHGRSYCCHYMSSLLLDSAQDCSCR